MKAEKIKRWTIYEGTFGTRTVSGPAIGRRQRIEVVPASELQELLATVEPFTIDGGVGCGAEEIDRLYETYQRLSTQQQEVLEDGS